MIKDITAQLYAHTPSETLYHYTTFSGFMGIVQRRTLWASDIRYMNDSAELRHTADLVRQEVNRRTAKGHPNPGLLTRFLDWIANRITNGHMLFAASFRTNGNLLSQWRGYSSPGKGVSIGLQPASILACARSQQFEIGKCVYDPARQAQLIAQVVDAVEALHARVTDEPHLFGEIESDLLRIAAVLKHPSFQEEEEWRIVSPVINDFINAPVKFREGTSMLVPYFEFALLGEREGILPIEHLYLGPTSSVELSMNSIRMFLAKSGINPRRGVEYCQIPYRQK
ncbi:MAG: DUF2971 domain-containing protein [Hahellaceae bacterium]|nr:DUF2971 domain-containing protein [Hahellaceae bacterium]